MQPAELHPPASGRLWLSEYADRYLRQLGRAEQQVGTWGSAIIYNQSLSGAANRWFGVIFADRGGGRFKLTDDERHAMWTLGKLAALAASARIATRQQERARRLYERIELAREVHERVMHRLFGVSLVLSSDVALAPADRERCRTEMRDALADLRTALERTLSPRPFSTSARRARKFSVAVGRKLVSSSVPHFTSFG